MPTADGSSTRGGSTSVRGRVRSPHISGDRPAAGSQRAYSLGWDKQTDGSRYRLMPPLPPPIRRRHKNMKSIIRYCERSRTKVAERLGLNIGHTRRPKTFLKRTFDRFD